MNLCLYRWALIVLLCSAQGACRSDEPKAQTLRFAGYEWEVREGAGGPGPNAWDARNAWVDEAGQLHLKISRRASQPEVGKPEAEAWSCAEVTVKNRLGFGRYQFQVAGRLDLFDPNVVLGLFNYTTPDVGPDGTNEIDIEFARWGEAGHPGGNYTVWPALPGSTEPGLTFPLPQAQTSTHRFMWRSGSVRFQSLSGFRENNEGEFLRWKFEPPEPRRLVPQHPLPLHLNLWLFRGRAPQNGKEIEIVIHSFSFKPG